MSKHKHIPVVSNIGVGGTHIKCHINTAQLALLARAAHSVLLICDSYTAEEKVELGMLAAMFEQTANHPDPEATYGFSL